MQQEHSTSLQSTLSSFKLKTLQIPGGMFPLKELSEKWAAKFLLQLEMNFGIVPVKALLYATNLVSRVNCRIEPGSVPLNEFSHI